jgi:hypothetical protein
MFFSASEGNMPLSWGVRGGNLMNTYEVCLFPFLISYNYEFRMKIYIPSSEPQKVRI